MNLPPQASEFTRPHTESRKGRAPQPVCAAATALLIGEQIEDSFCTAYSSGDLSRWELTWLTPTRVIRVEAEKSDGSWWSFDSDHAYAGDGPDAITACSVPRDSFRRVELVDIQAGWTREGDWRVESGYRLLFADAELTLQADSLWPPSADRLYRLISRLVVASSPKGV